jgi:hypothetical protein
MSNHSFTRPGGVWTDLTGLTAAEMADIDAKTVDSLSASGGTYALTADMLVGGAPGADWTFNLPVNLNSDLAAYGPVTLLSDLNVLGLSSLSDVSCNLLDVYQDAHFHDIAYYHSLAQFIGNCEMLGNVFMGHASSDFLLVSATADFEGPTSFNDPVHAYDTFTFHGATAFQGATAFNGGGVTITTALTIGVPVSLTLDGRIPKRQAIGTSAVNTNFAPRTYDHVYWPAGTFSGGDINAKIDDTGAVNGDRIRFSSNNAAVSYVQVLDPSGGVLAQIRYNASGETFAVDVERVAGVWRVVGASQKP